MDDVFLTEERLTELSNPEAPHTKWLVKIEDDLKAACGAPVELYEFQHQPSEKVLSAWAKHFRSHYCSDEQLDELRRGYGWTRSQYLQNIKFPSESSKSGPSIRAGDFCEILVADYLQYVLQYWVPRTRYTDKAIRNESTKGADILAFLVDSDANPSPSDVLAIFEAKAQLKSTSKKSRLQGAIDDSSKGELKTAESLNAAKQRSLAKGDMTGASRIERFQNAEDRPYQQRFGAVVVVSDELFDISMVREADTRCHPFPDALSLIVIRGPELMKLVHDLYKRAADEA